MPALGLKTGPPSTEQLPEDNPVREDFDVVQKAIGPGYEAPFVVVAATEDGTMTERDRLDQLARWQRKIAKDPAVQAVIGPEQVAKRTEPLKNTGNELRTSNEKGGDLDELNKLGPQLARAVERGRADPQRARPRRRPAPACSAKAPATPRRAPCRSRTASAKRSKAARRPSTGSAISRARKTSKRARRNWRRARKL